MSGVKDGTAGNDIRWALTQLGEGREVTRDVWDAPYQIRSLKLSSPRKGSGPILADTDIRGWQNWFPNQDDLFATDWKLG